MINNNEEIDIDQYPILLVEDDPNDIILIKRAFKKANIGHSLNIVENGEEAIAYLTGKEKFNDRTRYPLPTLILLDLKLPRISGHEVLEWHQKQPGIRRIPIIVLTSSKRRADINKAYDLGANSYLIKPVSFHSLLDLIRDLNMFWLNFNEKPEINAEGKK